MSGGRGRSSIGNVVVVSLLVGAALVRLFGDPALAWPDAGPGRRLAAAAVVLAYALLCAVAAVRARRAHRARTVDAGTMLVAHATQTGFAEELARQTADALRAAGHRVDLRPLSRVDVATLVANRVAFLVVATYGEGEAPDASRRFARDVLARAPDLEGLRFGLMALGDRSYADYCGFGRRVDAWLTTHGASRLFDPVEVDNGAATMLATWRERLVPWTGAASTPASHRQSFMRWTLDGRRRVNEGSSGAPMFHLSLTRGPMPTWEAGDIAVVRLPDGAQREYSIASLPSEGRLDLLVRQALRPDGRIGLGAEWLTSTLALGATTDRCFRLEGIGDETPLILIGNGTGIAGLRAHVKARMARGARRNWLFFGERNAAFDRPYADELRAWRHDGSLADLSVAYSRDQPERIHVQHRLLAEREAVARWIADGAVVLVCGSASGMAQGVDEALRTIVGDERVDDMAADGRYRRDVY